MVAEECPLRATADWRFQTHGLTPRGIRDTNYTTRLSCIKLADFPSRAELEAANHEARRKRERALVPSAAWALAPPSASIRWGVSDRVALVIAVVAAPGE
jgi:hypothetical protein